jgi:hypothetical protein
LPSFSAAMTTCVGLSEMMIGAALAGMSSRGQGMAGHHSPPTHSTRRAMESLMVAPTVRIATCSSATSQHRA